jgi:hypothetical protein
VVADAADSAAVEAASVVIEAGAVVALAEIAAEIAAALVAIVEVTAAALATDVVVAETAAALVATDEEAAAAASVVIAVVIAVASAVASEEAEVASAVTDAVAEEVTVAAAEALAAVNEESPASSTKPLACSLVDENDVFLYDIIYPLPRLTSEVDTIEQRRGMGCPGFVALGNGVFARSLYDATLRGAAFWAAGVWSCRFIHLQSWAGVRHCEWCDDMGRRWAGKGEGKEKLGML